MKIMIERKFNLKSQLTHLPYTLNLSYTCSYFPNHKCQLIFLDPPEY